MKPSPLRLPAEALAAVVGPARLLAAKPKPLTATDGRRAMAVPKRVMSAMRDFLEQKKAAKEAAAPEDLDYQETLALVSQTSEALTERLPALLQEVTNPELVHETADVLMLACEFLRGAIPRATEDTIFGTESLDPSRIDWATFQRQWAIANDPLSALDRLAEEVLVDDEVETLAQLYPQLYDRGMRGAFVSELATLKARDSEWEPRHDQRRQIETLLQISPIDADFARELQAINEAVRKPEGGIPTRPLQIDVKGMELPSQRLQAK